MDEITLDTDVIPTGPLPALEGPDGRVVGPGVPDSSDKERQRKRDLIFKRNYKKSHLEKKLDDRLKAVCPEGNLCTVVTNVLNDPLIASIQNYANVVSIQRLGY